LEADVSNASPGLEKASNLTHLWYIQKKSILGENQSLPSLGCVCVFNALINFYWVVEKLMSELHCGWTCRTTRL